MRRDVATCMSTPLRGLGVAIVVLTSAGLASAQEMDEAVWTAMKERVVVLSRKEGGDLEGRLVGVEREVVVVMRGDGTLAVVKKRDILSVRGRPSAPWGTPASHGRVGGPPGLGDPLRFPVRPGLFGLIMRPLVCLSECEGQAISLGLEVGYRFFSLALRYAHADNTHALFIDLRLYYGFRAHERVSVSPFFEIGPSAAKASTFFLSQSWVFQFALRPGVRIDFHVIDNLTVWIEPFVLDVGVYTGASSARIPLRLAVGFGTQLRF